MPNSCCVPGCKSNYKNNADPISVFRFPTDEERKKLWMKKINREGFEPTKYSSVCILHFDERFILREDSMTRPDGTVITAKRLKLSLTKDSYPTKFPNLPKYLSENLPKPRKTPLERQITIYNHDDQILNKWLSDDCFGSFENFCSGFTKRITKSGWISITAPDVVTIIKLDCTEVPKIIVSFKINRNFFVQIFLNKLPLDSNSMNWLLGPDSKCTRWTEFDSLLSHLDGFCEEEVEAVSTAEKLKKCVGEIKKIVELEFEPSDDQVGKINFAANQILLSQQKKPAYDTDFLLWCCRTLYTTGVNTYDMIRNSGMISMPHSRYLRKLSNVDIKDNDHPHIFYIKNKIKSLKPHEMYVNLLLDEIYVRPSISYTGGNLIGSAINADEPATTLQVFMITSVLSSNKDVIALYPIKNLKTELLLELVHKVLHYLNSVGFKVITLISDNNRVNRNMFERLCDNNMKSYIDHPYTPGLKLFLLFDTVHLLKCIRNNLLNQKYPPQTFVCPNFERFSEKFIAPLKPLKELYISERGKIIKCAPDLSEKVLFPSNLERQNVTLVVKMFNEKNIAALKNSNISNAKNLSVFIEIILKWWNIVNVKSPYKGKELRLNECNPIEFISDSNIAFLKNFHKWLSSWENMDGQGLKTNQRLGKLSIETSFSLRHTVNAHIDLCEYLLKDLKLSYVLLGKFQTDPLERKFSQYRQMSGGNYNISVSQVLESDKKLKIVNYLKTNSSIKRINIKSLEISLDEEDFIENYNKKTYISSYITQYKNLCNDIDTNLDENKDTLIYIAGYVAYTVNKKLNCTLCKSRTNINKNVDFDENNLSEYVKCLDRGGLKYPSDFVLNICNITFKIFEKILEHKENEFIKIHNQKQIIMQISMELIGNSENFEEICPCSNSLERITKLCVISMTNILLNNYSKKCINTIKYNSNLKKRKIETLTQ
jgi:hypothetical protein